MIPSVSVIVPTYNNRALLPETLDSVLGQSFADFEMIVVDDGSTDGTAAIIKNDYPQIRYFHQPNRGPAAARNAGVSLARGDYLAFCDHDDLWNPHHLRSLLAGFTSHPDAALVFDNAEYFGLGVEEPKWHLDRKVCQALSRGPVRPQVLLWDYPVASMSVMMVRKNTFNFLNGLNEQVGALDDLHFYLRLAARYEVRFVNYIGCKKRVTGGNLSQRINLKETNVCYLEELWRNHPEVVSAVGSMDYRLRLARKYFKLGRHYRESGHGELAREMFWKAYKTFYVNPRYFWHALFD